MLKKTITYEDFNGDEVTEDFYFHLSKTQLAELQISHKEGMEVWLKRVTEAEDIETLFTLFKHLILISYGKRSDDGRRFIKNSEIREEFESSNACDDLIIELITNTDTAIEFFNGIIPTNLNEQLARLSGIDPERTPIIAVTDENEDKTESDIVSKNNQEELL